MVNAGLTRSQKLAIRWAGATLVVGLLILMVRMAPASPVMFLAVLVLIVVGFASHLLQNGREDFPSKSRLVPTWAWFVGDYALLAALVATASRDWLLGGSELAAVTMFLTLLVIVPPLLILLLLLIRKDWTLGRVARQHVHDPDGAIARLQTALAEQPRRDNRKWKRWTAGRYHMMGRLHHNRGDLTTAVDWYEQALRLGGLEPELLFALGQALIQLGRKQVGFAALTEATTIKHLQSRMKRTERLILQAQLCLDHQRWDEARLALDRAAEALGAMTFIKSSYRKKMMLVLAILRSQLSRSSAALAANATVGIDSHENSLDMG